MWCGGGFFWGGRFLGKGGVGSWEVGFGFEDF